MNNPDQDVFVIRGGQGASKTISILQLIIQSLLSSEKEVTVLSNELSKMKRTVIRDYKKICKDWGVIRSENDFNKSESKHEYTNDSYIDFLGADVNDIGKGFRRDILYINEANKMDIETAVQFISRCKLTIIDYNPDAQFWGDDYVNDKNFITLTFEDNEYLSESEVRSILDYKKRGFFNTDLPTDKLFDEGNVKSKYWANKWKVYGLGMVGSLDGVVFDDWEECDDIPLGAKLIAIGLDFGYTNDPSAAEKVFEYNNDLYIDELFYKTGMTNQDIIKALRSNGVDGYMKIVADSAEPKSIREIELGGFNIEGAEKGSDSIRSSIDTLKQRKIYITRRSKNVKYEFSNWTWDKDKSGNTKNTPIGINDHAIAGIRYVALNCIGKPSDQISWY